MRKTVFLFVIFLWQFLQAEQVGLPVFYYTEPGWENNFGDIVSTRLVERIVGEPIRFVKKNRLAKERKLLAIGSVISFAGENDVIWGSGIHGKLLDKKHYRFKTLDVRAVRGPLTRKFLMENFSISCPEVYGDPGLLFPYFFPEFVRKKNPSKEYLFIPHYSEIAHFPKELYKNIIYPNEPWELIVEKILDSKLVVSSSLHGIIIAEAFGIPARLIKPKKEPFFKYKDYYLGTNRPYFRAAESLNEALYLEGEILPECDLERLYLSFPFEIWPNAHFKKSLFEERYYARSH